MSNTIEYLQNKGWSYKVSGNECIITCPYCQKEKHFYINLQSGLYDCKVCGEQGNLYKLKREMGDILPVQRSNQFWFDDGKLKKPEKTAVDQFAANIDTEALDYLTKQRGFTEETIKRFKLGVTEKNGSKCISIPYYQNGELVNFKFRSVKDKRFFREKDCKSSLYNQDNLDRSKPVIITEGEFDVIAASQLGFENVVSSPNGASGFDAEWIDFLDSFKEIYLAYDNDPSGEQGMAKLAERLGRYRCKRVYLPLKDFNECLLAGYTKENIQKYFDQAKDYRPKEIVHASDLLDRVEGLYESQEKARGTPTGWPTLDEKLGGIRDGEVTVLTADTGIGKTTWGLNLAYRMITAGKNVLIASTEMRPERLMAKLFSIHSGENFYNRSRFTDSHWGECVKFFTVSNLYFVNVVGEVPFWKIKEGILYSVSRFDVNFILLDHLHYFLDYKTENERFEIEKVLKKLRALVAETHIHVLLVVHPSKLKDESKPVLMNDLKGASAIKQDADNVIILHRKRAESTGTDLIIPKVRDSVGKEWKYKLLFNKESETYYEEIKEKLFKGE